MKRARTPSPHGTPKRREIIVPRIALHCATHPRDGFNRAKLAALTDAVTAEQLIAAAALRSKAA